MKNIIICSNDEINIKDLKNNYIKVYYIEGILEILEKNKNIDSIYIFEKAEGIITIKDLIIKIKDINKKIKIIYILEKNNSKKEKNLKKIGVNKIYIREKNIKKENKVYLIQNSMEENNLNNLLKYLNKKIKNKKILIINENKIKYQKIKNKNIKIIDKDINYYKYKKNYECIFILTSKEIKEKEIKNIDKIIIKINNKNMIEIINKIKNYNKKEKIILIKNKDLIDSSLLKEIVGKKIKIINK